jgi:hypothetical protein
MKMLRLRLAILVIALTLFIFGMAFQGVPEFGSLEELLMWVLEGGGAMLLAGYVVAYLLENLAFWHNLPLFVKKFTPFVLAALIGLGAKAVLLGDLLSYIPASIQVLILMLVGWLFSQIAYKGIKEGGYAASTRRIAGNG